MLKHLIKRVIRKRIVLTALQQDKKKARQFLTKVNKETKPTIILLAKKVVRNHEIEKLRAFKEQKILLEEQ